MTGWSVVTEDPAGGKTYNLLGIGDVGLPRYSTSWGGGCLTAEWQMPLSVDYSHFALTPGRIAYIYDGVCPVWRGVLTDPVRGRPWQINAVGLSSLFERYYSSSATPNTAVDAAITRGLPLAGRDTLTGTGATDVGSLADLMNLAANQTGKRWGVFADGWLTQFTDPTTVDYICIAVDTPGGRTIDDYATHLYGRYLNSAVSPPVPTTVAYSGNPGTNGPLGRYERIVDLTPLGPMLAAAAQTHMGGMLTLVGPRTAFTSSVTVQPGALLSPGGVPVALSTVKAGKLVRFIGCVPDPAMGELSYTTSVEVMIGQTEYDATTGLLRLTPVGLVARDLVGLLTPKAGPSESTASFVGAA